MDLWRRPKKIEREQAKHQARRGCSECGEGVPGIEMQYRVAFSDEPVDGPEHCTKCERSLRFAITFDQEGWASPSMPGCAYRRKGERGRGCSML